MSPGYEAIHFCGRWKYRTGKSRTGKWRIDIWRTTTWNERRIESFMGYLPTVKNNATAVWTRRMVIANKTCISGKKSRGLKICSRSILPVRQINIWQALTRVNFVSRLHERQDIIITKGGCLPTHLHKCCQNIRSYIWFTYLFTTWSLRRPNNVEFSGQGENE